MRRILALTIATLALTACVQQQPTTVIVARPAAACDTRFRVVNQSGTTVMQLFFSHSGLANWGNDQLGSAVLQPGGVWNYRAANTGNYDFRVVFADGRASELRRVNICAASQITVTNRGLVAT